MDMNNVKEKTFLPTHLLWGILGLLLIGIGMVSLFMPVEGQPIGDYLTHVAELARLETQSPQIIATERAYGYYTPAAERQAYLTRNAPRINPYQTNVHSTNSPLLLTPAGDIVIDGDPFALVGWPTDTPTWEAIDWDNATPVLEDPGIHRQQTKPEEFGGQIGAQAQGQHGVNLNAPPGDVTNPLGLYPCASGKASACWNDLGCYLRDAGVDGRLPDKCSCDNPRLAQCLVVTIDAWNANLIGTAEADLTAEAKVALTQTQEAIEYANAFATAAESIRRPGVDWLTNFPTPRPTARPTASAWNPWAGPWSRSCITRGLAIDGYEHRGINMGTAKSAWRRDCGEPCATINGVFDCLF